MFFRQIIDPHLAQHAYLIGCQRSGEALIIDPQRDVERYVELAETHELRLVAVVETHIHADFLSGARELALRFGARVYLSALGGPDWSYRWGEGLDVVLVGDGERIALGDIELRALHTPGHTPEHMSYVVVDPAGEGAPVVGVASGDFLFVGDLGRPDLLETAAGETGATRPAAEQLFRSLERLDDLPDYAQVWPGHGAGSSCGKSLGAVPTSTVGYERRRNEALRHARLGHDPFIEFILDGQPAPPLYFTRMKRLNRDGVPPLGQLPRPPRLALDELLEGTREHRGVIVDTRGDRTAFMRRHLRGSLFAPYGPQLPAVVGSYVGAAEPIGLIADPAEVDTIVRDLIHIGHDELLGYAVSDALDAGCDPGVAATEFAAIETATAAALERIAQDANIVVLDVRGASEFAERHVPGAINVPHTRLLERLDEIPSDRRIAVHCAVGQRSAPAAAMLSRSGRDVLFIDGPLSAWSGGA